MCGVCGCGETKTVSIEKNILSENERYAMENSQLFKAKNMLVLNMMSSPGSGKTSLLTKTLADLNHQLNAAVIVGDQQTECDATQLQSTGVTAIQVNTGKLCHLDAHMISHALEKITLQNNMSLFVENIGNLVCPVLFELGEHYKVVLLSVTEGDNKPLKYPDMFHQADLVIINKIDLLPYVNFDMDKCIQYIHQVNPKAKVLQVCATAEEGLSDWYEWLLTQKRRHDA